MNQIKVSSPYFYDRTMIDNTIKEIKTAVFVGIIKQNDEERKIMEYLEELVFLADTAGISGDKKFIQRVDLSLIHI